MAKDLNSDICIQALTWERQSLCAFGKRGGMTCMQNRKKLPVGMSDFEQIRLNDYYYVDKSGMIEELLTDEAAAVTLITRPRRFGKTLGMSMLASYFDIRRDSKKLFENLAINRNQELCNQWMNQYPVIFVSFKDVDGRSFESAYDMLASTDDS